MSSYFQQLNLRPQERRLVVLVLAVLFVVINIWFVWPHFNDWNRALAELKKAEDTLQNSRKETEPKRVAELQSRLRQLEGLGASMLPTEQSLDLIRAIQTQAAQSGVTINSQSEVVTSSSTKTNQFFEEKSRLITVSTGEKELVDFLVSLGSTNSIIRVRSMNIKPDNTKTRLQGSITVVASYQKNRPKSAAAPAPAPAAPQMNLAPPGSRSPPSKS